MLALLALGALPFLQHRGDPVLATGSQPVNLALQQELGDLSGVVEESRRRRPGGEGLRRRAACR